METNGITIGMDIAKSVFHTAWLNGKNEVVRTDKMKRRKVDEYFRNLEPCEVVMEACSGSHHWGRQLQKHGHRVTLLPPFKVKPYLQGQKNDRNDAVAIAEASGRPHIKPVAVKTVRQQDLSAISGMRDQAVGQRTQKCNSLRSHLDERDVTPARGRAALYAALEELTTADRATGALQVTEEITEDFILMLMMEYEQLQTLDRQIAWYDEKLKRLAADTDEVKRLNEIPGFGPVLSCVFFASLGYGKGFDCGRSVSAWAGLVPRQDTTGGKPKLRGVPKRYGSDLRRLLVLGANAVFNHAERNDDPLSRWVLAVAERRGRHKAVMALANKLARIGFAVLSSGERYDPDRSAAMRRA